ncbi:MAG: class I SAM-dependent methyltransferase [Acholeplasma sp.]|nr:class I SAM-dependent methyltransferase [Acholeplasma sp.]
MSFGSVYEALVGDIDYSSIVNFLKEHLNKSKTILDAGCGSGVFLIPLLEDNYQVEGIDLDGQMLGLAEEKLRSKQLYAKLYEHDLREPIVKKYDQIVLMNDVVNYFKGLNKVFNNLKRALNPTGILLFDCYKEEYLVEMDGYIEEDTTPFPYRWVVKVSQNRMKHIIQTNEDYVIYQTIQPLKYYLDILHNLGFQTNLLEGPDERKYYVKATL